MEIPRRQYIKNVLIAIDQLFNAAIGGYCDESLSSRCWRWHLHGVRSWPCRLIDALFWWDAEQREGRAVRHCELSWESERTGRQLPPELR